MKRANILILSTIITSNVVALDLSSAINKAIKSNPNIIQQKKQFNSIYETLKISQGDLFFPSIDFSGGITKDRKNYTLLGTTSKYTNKYLTISATENLFNGFGTVKDIEAKKAMLASSAYYYVQSVNELGLKVAKAYLDVVRNKELLAVELDNYKKHMKIFRAIKTRNRYGVGNLDDFQEIKAKTYLAYANYVAQKKNLKSSQITLKKLLGYSVDVNSIISPSVGDALSYSLPKAKEFAFTHNPTLMVQKYNVITARYEMQRDNKEFLPKIDLVASMTKDDGKNDITNVESKYKQYTTGITFSWNLFRGFKDIHTKNKNISIIRREHQKYNAIKRDLNEEIELAWMSYKMQQKEYNYLRNYLINAEAKMKTSTKLFRIGKKSLFEYLSVQMDYNSAKEKFINTKYDLVFTKFRVLKAMGILPDMIDPNIKAEVGIVNDGLYDYTKLRYSADKAPVEEESIYPEVSDDISYITNDINNNANINFGNQYAIVSPTTIRVHRVKKMQSIQKCVVYDDLNDERQKEVYDEEYVAPSYR